MFDSDTIREVLNGCTVKELEQVIEHCNLLIKAQATGLYEPSSPALRPKGRKKTRVGS